MRYHSNLASSGVTAPLFTNSMYGQTLKTGHGFRFLVTENPYGTLPRLGFVRGRHRSGDIRPPICYDVSVPLKVVGPC